jgi:lysozyme family protein
MQINDFIKTMKTWEGGLSRDMNDSASEKFCPTLYKDGHKYHTNKGITYAVWKAHFGSLNDSKFYTMNDSDWFEIFDKLYFKAVRGHDFKTLNIGAIVSEFAWGSGVNRAGKILQKSCNKLGANLIVDGIIGNNTLNIANSLDSALLFDTLIEERRAFFVKIAVGKNERFLKGWINRLTDNYKKFRP